MKMNADLVNKKFGHNKFWNAKLTNKTLVVHYGRIGTEGIKQIKRFKSSGEAMLYMDKKLKEKLTKGYRAKSKKATTTPIKKYHYKVEYRIYNRYDDGFISYIWFFVKKPSMAEIESRQDLCVPWAILLANRGKNDSIIIKKELKK